MDGFCRGCLIKYDEPMELLQYTERNRRLFVYSTGIQVKRNDTFTFQLCKDCYLNMKLACKFKKLCRTSDKRFKNYLALKDVGDPMDFCTFLKNNDETLTFRLPLLSGNSTPANQKYKDDDNESTCTSIRNFMTDILQGEEMPDTEARIIREVIEEEADVLDDSLDSQWLQDDVSNDADFRLDFSFSAFSTPRSVNNDRCYTPKKCTEPKDDEMHFYSTNSEKQNQIVKVYTDAIKEQTNVKDDFTNEFKDQTNLKDDLTIAFKKQSNAKDDITCVKEVYTNAFKSLTNTNKDLSNALKDQNSVKELCDYDIPSISQIEGIDKAESNLDLPLLDVVDKSSINIQSFYAAKNIVPIEPSEGMNDNNISIDNIDAMALVKDEQCTIDKNLEEALKNGENKEFSLDDLLVSPPVHQATSGASTPTIRNILFGEKLNLIDKKINPKLGKCVDSLGDVQCDIEIFEEFFQNDTREFNTEEIKSRNIKDSKELMNLDNIEIDQFENKSINIMDLLNNEKKLTNNDLNLSMSKNKPIDIDLELSFSEKELINDNNQDVSMSEKIISELDILLSEKKSMIENMDSLDFDLDIVASEKDQGIDDNQNQNKSATEKDNVINIYSADHSDILDFDNLYCHICSKKFISSRALSIHFVKSHRIKIIRPITHSYKHEPRLCNKCGKEFRQIANFHRHQKICQKPVEMVKCSHCPVECTSQKKLNQHMNVHKPKEKKMKETVKVKNFLCSVCGASFDRKNSYDRHVKSHTNKYLLSCEKCGKGFFSPSEHAAHMRAHNNIYPYSCKLCSDTFTRRDILARHIQRIHTDEKLFECDSCHKKFKFKYELKKHLNKKKPLNKKTYLKIRFEEHRETNKINTEKEGQVTVIYTKGDNDSIRNKLPYLETELSN